jgi:hypothetical protein
MFVKFFILVLSKFLYRWDQFFTLVDATQLKIWYKLNRFIDDLKHQEETLPEGEFSTWEEVLNYAKCPISQEERKDVDK